MAAVRMMPLAAALIALSGCGDDEIAEEVWEDTTTGTTLVWQNPAADGKRDWSSAIA